MVQMQSHRENSTLDTQYMLNKWANSLLFLFHIRPNIDSLLSGYLILTKCKVILL